MAELTAERLREALDYSPETGEFTRRKNAGRRYKAGQVAGSKEFRGYVQIRIDKKLYWAHRLAWLHMTGAWPTHDIDHIDGDKSNNRWSNLRDVPQAVNNQNVRSPFAGNSSGYLGVNWHPTNHNWTAKISVNNRTKYLGSYSTPEEAHAAYVAAKRELHTGSTL